MLIAVECFYEISSEWENRFISHFFWVVFSHVASFCAVMWTFTHCTFHLNVKTLLFAIENDTQKIGITKVYLKVVITILIRVACVKNQLWREKKPFVCREHHAIWICGWIFMTQSQLFVIMPEKLLTIYSVSS